jgi:hypothetical protein
MRVSGRTVVWMACAVLWSAAATSAAAHVCGDADESGTVTVTDGVQTLRSAASLSSACTLAACDVDGNGSITVTDGVNVLRKAAGLSITENCPEGGDDTADVAGVTDIVVPFVTLGLQQVPNVSSGASAVHAAATEDCEDGGSRTTQQSGITVTVMFDACKVSEPGLGRFQFDGTIIAQLGIPNVSVSFEFFVTNLDTSKLVDFDGTINGQPRGGGGFVVDGGPLSVRGPNEGPVIFKVTFHQLTVDGDGHLVSGSAEAEDTSDSFELATAELEVDDQSGTTATVHVVRDDQSTKDYSLNLLTGDLTPLD